MQGFLGPLQQLAGQNKKLSRVLYAGAQMQLMMMALKTGEEIGAQTYDAQSRFFCIQTGKGHLNLGSVGIRIHAGDAFVVPAGACHNVTNTGKKRLRLYAICSPPPSESPPQTGTKDQVLALAAKADLDLANKEMTNEGSPAPIMAK